MCHPIGQSFTPQWRQGFPAIPVRMKGITRRFSPDSPIDYWSNFMTPSLLKRNTNDFCASESFYTPISLHGTGDWYSMEVHYIFHGRVRHVASLCQCKQSTGPLYLRIYLWRKFTLLFPSQSLESHMFNTNQPIVSFKWWFFSTIPKFISSALLILLVFIVSSVSLSA